MEQSRDAIRAGGEEQRLRLALALSRHDYDDLLRACRAAVAADAIGHRDPLFWVRDTLGARGQLPMPGVPPEQVAAAPHRHHGEEQV
ncbi:hypothetical protein OHA25_41145 [Nonomuraea sp. NBC_00507]|uniref:hypothetical protein n=1 Tax=Nonomuraea sp. NBC_00507 TaxID=2976002 RepID=UPI002E176518